MLVPTWRGWSLLAIRKNGWLTVEVTPVLAAPVYSGAIETPRKPARPTLLYRDADGRTALDHLDVDRHRGGDRGRDGIRGDPKAAPAAV